MSKIKRILAITLSASALIFQTACAPNKLSQDSVLLSKKEQTTQTATMQNTMSDAYLSFCGKIYSKFEKSENNLFSPLSLFMALSILTEGASGVTQAELLDLLGMDIQSLRQFNLYLYDYFGQEKYASLIAIANSIWVRDIPTLHVNDDYLSFNGTYYGANVYKSPFNKATVKDINTWVKNNTFSLIDKIIDNISNSAMLYIINTVALDLSWASPWHNYTTLNFTNSQGESKQVDSLKDVLGGYYASTNATAFTYRLEKGIDFMGILPNEDVSNYTLDEQEITCLLNGYATQIVENGITYNLEVYTSLPAFAYDYSVSDLTNYLQDLGVTSVFDSDKSDLSPMGTYDEGRLFVSGVSQKTTIEVTKTGVKAAAVTMIEVAGDGAPMPPEYIKKIYIDLNRPFYYMIYDRQYKLPLFIGRVTNIS